MKLVASIISEMSQADISELEKNGTFNIDLEGVATPIDVTEVEIISEDIPGWLVANEGKLTVALDINITEFFGKASTYTPILLIFIGGLMIKSKEKKQLNNEE